MKKKSKNSVLLTALLIFLFAVFGGGTLSALGIIPKIPFFSDDSTASTSPKVSSSGTVEPNVQEVIPKDIHIYTPESPVLETDNSEDTEIDTSRNGNQNITDQHYVFELKQKSNPSSGSDVSSSPEPSAPESPPNDTSSTPTPPDNSSTPTPLPTPGDINKPDRGGSSGNGSSKKVTSVLLDQADVTINRSNTLLLTATVAPSNATNKTVTWISSNPAVASVDSNGQVTALSPGTTAISAKAGNITAVCDVTVIVLMDGVSLNHEQMTLLKGRSEQLTAKVTPEDTTENTAATWTSSDTDIAVVDKKGKVTAVKPGTTTVTATINGITASCEVTVKSPLEGIAIEKPTLTLPRSTSEKLTVSYLPGDTTDPKDITWSTSDANIVAVDQQGNVTSHSLGSAVITANVGDFIATSAVTVTAPLQGIQIDKNNLTINRHKSDTLTVSYLPGDTTDPRDIIWSSSDSNIADVDQQGNVIAYNKGTVIITATVGEFAATCDVTVIALIDGIYLDQSSMTLDRGTGGQLTAHIEPEDTTEDKTVVWSSSNPDVATVDTTGKMTAVSAGATSITAQVGEHTATCEVTVVTLIHSIALNKSSLTLDRGTNEQLAVSIDPPDSTEDTTVTWRSSDPAVATVDADGKVTATGIGTAIITAQVGEHTVTCEVTVVALIHSIVLDKTTLTLDRGTNEQLTVSLDPPDTTQDKTVVWASSAPGIATVDTSGKVTAVGIGTATITATVGQHTATCDVTVVALIHSISLNKSSMTLDRGTSDQLTVSIEPADTTEDTTVTWRSSNAAVATVDTTGKVTAVAAGTATITATVGEHITTCEVTVVALIHSIALGKSSITLDRGTSEQLAVSINPLDTTEDTTVTWRSNNPAVATVDADGKVTATGIGTAIITAQVGEHTATCKVNVVVLLKGIVLNQNALTINRGTTNQLSVTITPTDTTESKVITWSSSNSAVAKVDNTGKVTAVSAGAATITAQVGKYAATIQIKVVVPITGISLNKTYVNIKQKGATEQLSISITPMDTTENKNITWTSSDPNIATVDANGKVTAGTTVGGETTITAKVGMHTATCVIGVGLKYTTEAWSESSGWTTSTSRINADGSGVMGMQVGNKGAGSAKCYLRFNFEEPVYLPLDGVNKHFEIIYKSDSSWLGNDDGDTIMSCSDITSYTLSFPRYAGDNKELGWSFNRKPGYVPSVTFRIYAWGETPSLGNWAQFDFSWKSGNLKLFGQPITASSGYLLL